MAEAMELLMEAKSLLELDDEASTVGSDVWVLINRIELWADDQRAGGEA